MTFGSSGSPISALSNLVVHSKFIETPQFPGLYTELVKANSELPNPAFFPKFPIFKGSRSADPLNPRHASLTRTNSGNDEMDRAINAPVSIYEYKCNALWICRIRTDGISHGNEFA